MDTIRKKHKANKKKDTENVANVSDLPKQSPQSAVPTPPISSKPAQTQQNQSELPSEKALPVQPVTPAASSDPLRDFKEKMIEEEHPFSNMPQKKNFMWPILFIVFLALALLFGIFIYKQGVNREEKINVVTLVTPTVIAKPTKAEIDLSKYPIKILNGSEIKGEAGRQKDNLEGEGFIVSSIGNAARSDYTKTIIQAKENVDKAFLDKLKSVLENTFTLGEIEILSEDATTPVIIILGTKK